MATAPGNIRDVRLGVEVATAGEDDLRRLAGAVRALGNEGDPAAAEFARLADQLDRLAAEAATVDAVRRLRGELEGLSVAQRNAASTASDLAVRLADQLDDTTRLTARQRELRAEVSQAATAQTELRAALESVRIAGQQAGESEAAYASRVAEARQQLNDQTQALRLRRQALREITTELSGAVQAEGRLETQYNRVAKEAVETAAAIRQQGTALAEAESAAERAGVNLAEIAAAQTAYRQSLSTTLDDIAQYQALQRARAEADELAALEARALAEAQRQGAAAAQAELAAIADSEDFVRRYAAAKERAAASAIQFVTAIEREEAALRDFGRAEREAAAEAERLAARQRDIVAAFEAADAEARESAAAMELLEAAAREADAQMERLAQSLRETENAARRFTQASEQAASAGAGDVAAVQARVRAAEALIASERELTVAQRELAAQRDRGREALLSEASAFLAQQRAIEASAAAMRQAVAESIRLGTALDGTGRSIGRIGTLTEEAFGKTGVRSLQAIEAEIAGVERAMSLLERRFQSGQISADDLARAISSATVRLDVLKREAATIPALSTGFERINTAITGLLSRFGALSAAIATVGVAVRPVLDATVALEQMRRTLTTVTGSAETASQQIDFLRRVSQQSGQQFDQLGASYAKFAASALQSGLTIQQTQEVFQSVALAAGNLGLSSDQAKRALEALSQIASKGTVSMEELRQQLGDALPGVLPLLAKELGITQAQLVKVVEAGELLAGEAIPAIGRALTALRPQDGVVNGMVATWNRFINVVKQAGVEIVEGPLGTTAGVVLNAFGGVIRDISVAAVSASEAIGLMGRVVGTTAAAFANGREGLRGLADELDRLAIESGERIQRYRDNAYAAAQGTKQLADEIKALGGSFAALAVESQKTIDQANLQAQSAEKNFQAKQKEAEATNRLAGLINDETTQREAAVLAAESVLRASERQLAADQAVLAALERSKAAIEAKAAAEGLSRDAIQATIAKLDEKIAKATADIGKTEAQTAAARAHALALDVAAEAASNNAGRIDQLRKNVEAAEAAFRTKVTQMGRDRATSEEVRKAAEALAKAKALLRDAIDDVSEALEQQLGLLRADAKMQEASIKLELERAKQAQIAAAAEGNLHRVKQEGLRIKELELSLSRQGNDLKAQEAAATLRALDVQERELRASGQLTPQKAAEIEVRRKNAIAATLEAEAANVANKSHEKEIELLRTGGTAHEQYNQRVTEGMKAIDGNTSSTGRNTTARDANTRAIGDQIKAIDNFNRVLDEREKLIGQGLSGIPVRQPFDDTSGSPNAGKDLSNIDAITWMEQGGRPPPGYRYKVPGDPSQGIVKDTTGSGTLGANGFPDGWGSTAGKTSAFGVGFGGTTTVNLQINGGAKTPVKVASPADAEALSGFFAQLGDAQRDAGSGGLY